MTKILYHLKEAAEVEFSSNARIFPTEMTFTIKLLLKCIIFSDISQRINRFNMYQICMFMQVFSNVYSYL